MLNNDMSRGEKMKLRAEYLNLLVEHMVEPRQEDFIFVHHRDEDDHNHSGSLRTEIRAAVIRDAKVDGRENLYEPAPELVQVIN